MDKVNSKKLWKEIQISGDLLKNKLPPHPNHPKGRNPYAHIALEIKNKFGMTYKDIPNRKYEKVIEFIKYLIQNPK